MRRIAALLLVGAVGLIGCSSGSDDGASAPGNAAAAATEEAPFELDAAPVQTTEVTAVKSYRFEPAVIEVAAGAEVTWTNKDDFPHNVRFLTGSDETHDLPIGDSVAVSFEETGNYYYECSLHPQQMRGEVIVTD